MRPGDIVLFSDGLFGMKAPENMGVLLEEYKEKKTRMVRLLTVKGKKSASRKNVRSVVCPGPDTDDESVRMKALREAIAGQGARKGGKGGAPRGTGGKGGRGPGGPGDGRLTRDPKQVYEVFDVLAVWKKVAGEREGRTSAEGDGGSAGEGVGDAAPGAEEIRPRGVPEWYTLPGLTTGGLARAAFGELEFSKEQLASVDKAVVEKEKGRGYFARKESSGEVRFFPLDRSTANDGMSEANSVRALRKYFTLQVEDEEGEVCTEPIPDMGRADVPDELASILETVKRRMRHFLTRDGWDADDGMAGTGLWVLGDEDLGETMASFARALAGDHRLDISSACADALISLGDATWEEVGRMLVTRGVTTGEYAFSEGFDDSLTMEAGRIPDGVRDEDMEGREDLRELETYTIDPPDAKDFDDAISIREGDDGEVTLWVHIADVSHYIRPGSHIDEEARKRATSVYLPTGVLPMLPPKLSEDLCSLCEGVPRLAMTVKMTFRDGETTGEKLVESVIQVDGNLSYEAAMEKFDAGEEPFGAMLRLSETLQGKRARPDIQTAERRVRYGEDGCSITAALKRATRATSMIESFMVAANEAAARYLRDNEVAGVYRVHPLPARADIERFNKAVTTLGLDCPITIDYDRFTEGGAGGGEDGAGGVGGEAGAKSRRGKEAEAQQAGEDAIIAKLMAGGKFSLIPGGPDDDADDTGDTGDAGDDGGGSGDDDGPGGVGGGGPGGSGDVGAGTGHVTRAPPIPLDPEKIEHYSSAYAGALEIINAGDDQVFRDVMNLLVLRTMPRAFYATSNMGHFGLKSECYTHFTSPIRRYPDVLVHRAVRALLREEEPPHGDDELDELVDRCNDHSLSAERFEHAMTDAALAIWLSRDRGERDELRSGVVFSLAPSAMFVQLEHGVEGRIPLSKLSEMRAVLDESEVSVILSTLENPELAIGGLGGTREDEAGHIEKVLYTLGEHIRVTIHRIFIARGRVELGILHQGAEAADDTTAGRFEDDTANTTGDGTDVTEE